jgi:hypothetical protein
MAVDIRRKDGGAVRLFGGAIFALLNILAVLFVAVLASELLLSESSADIGQQHVAEAVADELVRRGYYPDGVEVDPYKQFEVLDPHPDFGWFWSPNEDGAFSRETAVVSIDADGFRAHEDEFGNALEQKKALAFLIGGSSAFGYRSSTNDTTITSHLNKVQNQIVFINAGVVGWDSSQERRRLKRQLAAYSPQLVVSYSLGNDLERTVETLEARGGLLEQLAFRLAPNTSERVFPLLYNRLPALGRWMSREPSRSELEIALDAAVDSFLDNQKAMWRLGQSAGFGFVSVIQAMTMTHDRASVAGPRAELYRRAVRRALMSDYCRTNCLDYSAVFDPLFDPVLVLFEDHSKPVLDANVDLKDVAFADQWHLLDAGNAIVAGKLADDLGLAAAEP